MQKGFGVILFLIVILMFSLAIIGGSFFARRFINQNPVASAAPVVIKGEPEGVSCAKGIDGNSGDNFCSNYHGGGSLCRPGFAENYPDDCTKTNTP